MTYESISQRRVLLPGAMQPTSVSDTVGSTPREPIGQRATRTSNLSRGHRVVFPPRAERSRVGEVPATIAVHYAVHVAHVRQLAGDLHARHAHTRHAKSARDGIRSLARARAPMYARRYTRPVSSDIASLSVICGRNGVEIRSDGHSRT